MKEFNKLTVKNLYKSFGDLKALNDFNLTLEKTEFVTFLGPSGCGKSTALNCICGLIPITKGEIYADEECIDNATTISTPPERRGFGMVFQNYALFPHLSVAKNIAFGLELKKISRGEINDKVEKVLSLVHLEGYAEKYPSQLSGGQQQRVAIARCIVMEPRLLLLDEPLSNLDAKLRVEMRYELKQLHDRLNIATIYVTHDQQEALALSDKIVVMKYGVIQQVGTPEEIYTQPANLFVADFMGFRNLWNAKIEQISENGGGTDMTLRIDGNTLTARQEGKQASGPRSWASTLKKGMEVITAIRPEDFSVEKGPVNNINCRIAGTEYLGDISHISGSIGNGIQLDARPDSTVKIGETVGLYCPPEKIRVFAKEEPNGL
jgi:putative spermidine/putrescine transport system ATP-binding protein